MQLIVNIQDENLADKVLWFLKSLSDKGVKIEKQIKAPTVDKSKLTEEYMKKNWKEIIMSCKSDPDYYKNEQYYDDRGEYLMEKYK